MCWLRLCFWGIFPHTTQKHHTLWEKIASLLGSIPFLWNCAREILTLLPAAMEGLAQGSGLPLLTTVKLDGMDEVTVVRFWTKTVQDGHLF